MNKSKLRTWIVKKVVSQSDELKAGGSTKGKCGKPTAYVLPRTIASVRLLFKKPKEQSGSQAHPEGVKTAPPLHSLRNADMVKTGRELESTEVEREPLITQNSKQSVPVDISAKQKQFKTKMKGKQGGRAKPKYSCIIAGKKINTEPPKDGVEFWERILYPQNQKSEGDSQEPPRKNVFVEAHDGGDVVAEFEVDLKVKGRGCDLQSDKDETSGDPFTAFLFGDSWW